MRHPTIEGASSQAKAASDHGDMDEAAIIDYVSGLSGVVTFTASEENDAPASAWGDTFFFYDPEGKLAENQRLPFATVSMTMPAGMPNLVLIAMASSASTSPSGEAASRVC
jgi:hypothetical protein